MLKDYLRKNSKNFGNFLQVNKQKKWSRRESYMTKTMKRYEVFFTLDWKPEVHEMVVQGRTEKAAWNTAYDRIREEYMFGVEDEERIEIEKFVEVA